MTTFVALDVETANPDLSSICQIGIVQFQGGKLGESWVSLVNPEDYFEPVNISIHGIDNVAVENAPTFRELYSEIKERLSGAMVASHSTFDRLALARASEKYNLNGVECKWLNTIQIVRSAWPEFSMRGYGLANVCAKLGITFTHHSAEEVARAAGEVLLRAIAKTGIDIEEWLDRISFPINPSLKTTLDGNPDGSLFGEVLVFTGELTMSRRIAADAAAQAGCRVDASVTKKTTLLVVGDQDIRNLAGHEKSAKHRKAEQLIVKGVNVRIVGESDFTQLIAL